MTLRVHIPGRPVAKGRPRATRSGVIYTPQKTRTWEGIARSLAMDAMQDRPPLSGPVSLRAEIVLEVPQSWPRWKRAAAHTGAVSPTTKPDMDNVVKALKDAFNGVVWRDDAQIVEACVVKVYADAGNAAGVHVEVDAHDSQAAQTARREPGSNEARGRAA